MIPINFAQFKPSPLPNWSNLSVPLRLLGTVHVRFISNFPRRCRLFRPKKLSQARSEKFSLLSSLFVCKCIIYSSKIISAKDFAILMKMRIPGKEKSTLRVTRDAILRPDEHFEHKLCPLRKDGDGVNLA